MITINISKALEQSIVHLERTTDAYILSEHNAIANKFIEYADNIWKTVRAYQKTTTVVPTDAEFQMVLDGVVF
jgi:hypothetical protein